MIACAAVTLFVAVIPGLRFAYRAPTLHVAIETAATLVALLVAFLVGGRLQRAARADLLLLFAALTLLATSELAFAMIPLATGHGGRFPTWAATSDRVLAGFVLAASAFAPSRPPRIRWGRAAAVAAAACVVAVTAACIVLLGEPRLVGHPVIRAIQLAGAAVYVSAAFGFARKHRRGGDTLIGWLALATVLAAFARVNYFLYPSLSAQWVYVGDAFRLGFYLLLLVGALREITDYFGIAVRAAVLEERRRIARDLHDTFAQELAFISRNVPRLRDPDADEDLAGRLAAAAERAARESRQLIATLAAPVREPLDAQLARVAQDAAARYGAEVEVAVAEPVRLDPERSEALLRIAAEAVANAAHHGRAESIRVTLGSERGRPHLQVHDGGIGFDPATVTHAGGFGLVSMRERAQSVNGRFRVESGRGGTTVDVTF